MKVYARTILLKSEPGVVETYLEHHRRVWPEVERGLKSIGIKRMRIWRLGRQLFMLMETVDSFDPARDFARYEASAPRIREWQTLMASMQQPVPEARSGEWWAEMELVYSLEA